MADTKMYKMISDDLRRIEAKLDALLGPQRAKEIGSAPAKYGGTPVYPPQQEVDPKMSTIKPPDTPTPTIQPALNLRDQSTLTPPTVPEGGDQLTVTESPIPNYEKATVAETLRAAKTLDDNGRQRLLQWERQNKNRDGVVDGLENWEG